MGLRILICIVLVYYSREAPTVTLLANRYVQKDKDVRLNCSSDTIPSGMTVEFITDAGTIGNIRSHKGICFNTLFSQTCTPNTCQCHENGMSYAMFYRLYQASENLNFWCKMKFTDNKVIYSDKRKVSVLDLVTPIIYLPGQKLISGLIVSLMCIAKRTSEDITFRWACGFTSQTSRIRNNSTSVWTKIQLKVDSAFDNKPCICTLQSTRTNFSVSNSVVLDVEKSPLLTLKEEFKCNITETVTLVCSVRGDLAIFGFDPWRHSIDGTYIRSLKGSNDAYVSLLFINACSYQDAGEYTCIVWNKHTGETYIGNKTTTLVVTGPPVILKKETSQIGPRNIFVILFYTRPIIVGVQVQCSGELLNTSADMTTEIKRENLELNFHGKVVIVSAFRYTIALTNKHCVSQKYTVCIKNKFEEQCEIFEPQKDIEEDMNYLWLIVGVGFIVLIVVVIVVVLIVYKKHSVYRHKSAVALTEQVGNTNSVQTTSRTQYLQPVHIQEGSFQYIRTSSSNQVQTGQMPDENFYELSDTIVNENLEPSPFEAADNDRVPPYLEIQTEAEYIGRTSDGYEKVE